MQAKTWAITMGVGAAVGAVAVMMMPRNNPARKLAAKAANKMEDVAWKLEDRMNMDHL
jgi:gas vesicle protein